MSELCEFLLARIAEDLTVAQHDLSEAMTYEGLAPGVTSNLRRERRRLADCEAKCQIVRRVQSNTGITVADDWVLNLLVLPYADHPDFREEWTCT